MLGPAQVIAIDCVLERLDLARLGGATTINFEEESVIERLNELTRGKGPDKCIDCVGMEAHVSHSFDNCSEAVSVRASDRYCARAVAVC